MNSADEKDLDRWAEALSAELGLGRSPVDVADVLALAARVAHAVVRPAAPVSTFLVGYAAGLAAARGEEPDEAIRTRSDVAARFAEHSEGPEGSKGSEHSEHSEHSEGSEHSEHSDATGE